VDGEPFVTVPVGCVIETQEDIRSPGLAEIRWNNQPLSARMPEGYRGMCDATG
jgi:hypothetical protein